MSAVKVLRAIGVALRSEAEECRAAAGTGPAAGEVLTVGMVLACFAAACRKAADALESEELQLPLHGAPGHEGVTFNPKGRSV